MTAMKLERSIVFFDIEATGVAPSEDRIVDIALLRHDPHGRQEAFCSLVDPGVPIPIEAQAVHHISDEMVRGKPTFKELAPRVLDFMGDSDLGGFGIVKFDVPMLLAEFKRAGLAFPMEGRRVVDALTIYHRHEPRNLAAAVRFYCGRELVDAHRAEADARAAAEVFMAQLQRYPQLPRNIAGLAAYCGARDTRNVDADGRLVWRNGKASFNFGKYRTLALDEVARREPGYLEWLASAERTSPELVRICREALRGNFPTKQPPEETAKS